MKMIGKERRFCEKSILRFYLAHFTNQNDQRRKPSNAWLLLILGNCRASRENVALIGWQTTLVSQ